MVEAGQTFEKNYKRFILKITLEILLFLCVLFSAQHMERPKPTMHSPGNPFILTEGVNLYIKKTLFLEIFIFVVVVVVFLYKLDMAV